MTRYITKNSIPRRPMQCSHTDCVYNGEERHDGTKIDDGICDYPSLNRGNSDAECFGVRPRTVMTWLTELDHGDS